MPIQVKITRQDYSVVCTPASLSPSLFSGTYTTTGDPLGTFTITCVGGALPNVYTWTRLSGTFASVASGTATSVLTLNDSSGQIRSVGDLTHGYEYWRCTVHDKFTAYSTTIDVTLDVLFTNA